MGTIDANGVYIYDNTDQMIPHATYSNLLANSVSDALETLRDDLTPVVIPWTSTGLTIGSSQSTSGVEYMVDGSGNVHWRGEIYGATPATNGLLITFPASIQPTTRRTAALAGLGGAATVFVGIYGGTGALNELRYRTQISGSWSASSATATSLNDLTWNLL